MVGGASAAEENNEVGSGLGSDRKRVVRWRLAAVESGGWWRSKRLRRWRRRERRAEADIFEK